MDAWRGWAAAHPGTRAELAGADLEALDLRGVELRGANLTGANLRRTRLDGADLSEALLTLAELSEASFSGALLRKADLRDAMGDTTEFAGAALDRADGRGAQLPHCNFSRASLDEARLDGANLSRGKFWGVRLRAASLVGADLSYADFNWSILHGARLQDANLEHAYFVGSSLCNADLSGARLGGTNCQCADLTGANLHRADLTGACLTRSTLVSTNFDAAVLVDCGVYGIAAWDLIGMPARQTDLYVSDEASSKITVDNLEVAQVVHLLLKHHTLRKVIESVTSKAVLILGRFTSERKSILHALADALRSRDFIPIVFDFERVTDRDFTETIKTLAGLSIFVVADITNPRSAPLELQATVPDYQIPFVSILQKGEEPFSMFRDLWTKHDWMLEPVDYVSEQQLLRIVQGAIVDRAMAKHQALRERKQAGPRVLSGEQFDPQA